MFVDSHCHLDFDDFTPDRQDVLARAFAADVGTMLTICIKANDTERIKRTAALDPRLFCTVGTHPHHVEEVEDISSATLIALADDSKVVGLGETGLDYYYEHAPRTRQQASFRAHIEAARVTGLPIIVHTRDADEDTIKILQEEYARGAFTGVIHCFTAGRALAEAVLELGFYISLSGILTFKSATDLQAIARDLPLERLLIETDAPYLAPIPMRGKRNEPSFVTYTAAFLAHLKGLPVHDVARVTTDNFFTLFRKATRPCA
jgi:TatD DNase family protein